MNDFNRKVGDRSWKNSDLQCTGLVHGNIEISRGDLLFLDKVDGLRGRGSSVADYYIYPFSKVSGTTLTLASNRTLAKQNFVGVASWHSDSGVTEEISIDIQGLFSYPLKHSRHTLIYYNVIPAGSGTTLYNQRVAVESGTTDAIGKVANSGKFQSSVEMFILPDVFRYGSIPTP